MTTTKTLRSLCHTSPPWCCHESPGNRHKSSFRPICCAIATTRHGVRMAVCQALVFIALPVSSAPTASGRLKVKATSSDVPCGLKTCTKTWVENAASAIILGYVGKSDSSTSEPGQRAPPCHPSKDTKRDMHGTATGGPLIARTAHQMFALTSCPHPWFEALPLR